MIPTQCNLPPGLVGIVTGDLSRYPAFQSSIFGLLVPEGSGFSQIRGNDIACNRNLIVKDLKPHHEWVWFIDDDHAFEPDTLLKLISHGVDIVQPLVSTRKPPFYPYGYWKREKGYQQLDWTDLPESGLMEVDAVGTGGMLVWRGVLNAVGDPWFEEGKTGPDALGEDLYFCTKAKGVGFRVFVDCDLPIGHLTTAEVWPRDVDGTQYIDLNLLHGTVVRVNADFGRKHLQVVE